MNRVVLVFLLIFGVSSADMFVPTAEYRPVDPSQHLPPGVQVRVNLATGQKEARWFQNNNNDDNGNNDKSVLSVPTNEVLILENNQKHGVDSVNVIEKAERSEDVSFHNEKTVFERRRVDPDDDMVYAALVRFAMSQAHNSTIEDTEDILFVLSNLEELAHHVDLGAELTRPFIVNETLTVVPFEILLSRYSNPEVTKSPSVRQLSANIMAAALQNNNAVIQWVYADQFMARFVDLILFRESNTTVTSSLVSVLSAATRAHDKGLEILFSSNDNLMAELLRSSKEWKWRGQRRLWILLLDSLEYLQSTENHHLKFRQGLLSTHDSVCERIQSTFHPCYKENTEQEECHHIRDVMNALLRLHPGKTCDHDEL